VNRILAALTALVFAVPATAQTNIDLGGIAADPSAPVEIIADNLNVDQDTGSAVFSGNVVIGQGDLRLSAPSVQVSYAAETGDITRLQASGGVTFATATEAAEAQSADYNLASGLLTLNGDVMLTQGKSALSSDSMILDLNAGTAQMSGRVRTVFQQDGNN
jgi:lipopolysaccharide export system protein LptA